jgi:hypothetical protein
MHNNRNSGVSSGLIDLLFNLVLGLTMMIIIAFLLIQETKKSDHPELALGLFIIEWEPEKNIDNDVWIRDPTGNILSFKNRTTPLITLDRDDLGNVAESVDVITQKFNPLNREIVTVRAWYEGTWTVNIHVYGIKHQDLTNTTVSISFFQLSNDKRG